MPVAPLDERLSALLAPYFSDKPTIDPTAFLIEDLGVTGSDYLDFVHDVEQVFDVDLTSFLIGPNPQFVSRNWLQRLLRHPPKPVFRDFKVQELANHLAQIEAREG